MQEKGDSVPGTGEMPAFDDLYLPAQDKTFEFLPSLGDVDINSICIIVHSSGSLRLGLVNTCMAKRWY